MYILFVSIPLVLSAFTHLWNPIGFPSIHPDEGTYLRRAMYVMKYLSPQDPSSRFDHSQVSTSSYDHPYFGQLFLAGVFRLIGYPGLLDPKPGDVHSIEMLYMVPRVLMGLLAVVDTFLIYKIAEVRYNRKVAFIASILFAVMPITWLTRRIVLDSILMPFLLSSILFAVYYNKTNNNSNKNGKKKNNPYLILLSGIFLGLAIFTKIPAFTMIPLVAFLIIFAANNTNDKNQNNNNNNSSLIRRIKGLAKIGNTTSLKSIAIWFIPVILIPLIWPLYAVSVGQFDAWFHGVSWQATERQEEGKTFLYLINTFFRNDPVLLVLGGIGLIFAVAKRRDFFFLLWTIPFLIFIYLVGWVTHFHLITLLPAFCVSAAVLITDLPSIIIKNNNATEEIKQTLLPYAIISAIAIFGLVSTIMIITTNISSSQFEAAAFVAKDTQNSSISNNDENRDDITIISSPIYSWIFKYVFHRENVFSHIRDSSQPIRTEKEVLIVDSTYKFVLSQEAGEEEKQIELLKSIDKNTYTVASFRDNGVEYDKRDYPYTSMREAKIGGREIDVQANY